MGATTNRSSAWCEQQLKLSLQNGPKLRAHPRPNRGKRLMKARLKKAMAIPATNTRCRLRLMLQIGFLDRGVDVGAVVDTQPIQGNVSLDVPTHNHYTRF